MKEERKKEREKEKHDIVGKTEKKKKSLMKCKLAHFGPLIDSYEHCQINRLLPAPPDSFSFESK